MIKRTVHSDDALLAAMINDDQDAFALLYRRHWEELFIAAARVLRSKEEAADVVQDVFLSLWRRRSELDIQGPLIAYLRTSIRYKAIHYIERKITRKDYLASFIDVVINSAPPTAEQDLYLKEVQHAINEVVAQMPERMQEVFRLSRQELLTHKEIADRLGISVETVKKHVQHALKLVKERLKYALLCIYMVLYQNFF